MKVKAPEGYHWMKSGKGAPKLMKNPKADTNHTKEVASLLILKYKKCINLNG